VAVAYVQEFEIKDGDTSTTNYDAVNAALNLQGAPEGLLIHTAGFDLDAGVFRIFDVWETREPLAHRLAHRMEKSCKLPYWRRSRKPLGVTGPSRVQIPPPPLSSGTA
jgi:hypothetical protein